MLTNNKFLNSLINYNSPTLFRRGFVLLGIILEMIVVLYSTSSLFKSITYFIPIIILSIIFWIYILYCKNVLKSLVFLVFILIPYNRFLILRSDQAYIFGRISDYLLITLSLFEIPLYLLILWTIFQKIINLFNNRKLIKSKLSLYKILTITRGTVSHIYNSIITNTNNLLFFLFFVLFVITSIINSTSYYIIIIYINLILVFVFVKKFFNYELFRLSLYINVIFQTIISVLQLTTNKSLGLFFLGESQFDDSLYYIAKTMFGGEMRVRAYGTFPHPNVLAAFAIISIAVIANDLFISIIKNKVGVLNIKLIFKVITISGSLLTLYLTQSRTVLFSLASSLVLLTMLGFIKSFGLKKTLIAFPSILLLLFIPLSTFYKERFMSLLSYDRSSYINRVELTNIVFESIAKDRVTLIFGMGPGGFLEYHSINNPIKTSFTFIIEPVHNVFLLILSEFGFIGLLILIVYIINFIIKIFIKPKDFKELIIFVFLTPYLFFALNLDHYLITLKQGVGLFAIVISLLHYNKYKDNKTLKDCIN